MDPRTDDVLVAAEGELFATMTARSAGGATSLSAPSQGLTDIFLAKFTKDGIVQWIAHVGGRGIDDNPFVAVRPDSRIYLVSPRCSISTVVSCPACSMRMSMPSLRLIPQQLRCQLPDRVCWSCGRPA